MKSLVQMWIMISWALLLTGCPVEREIEYVIEIESNTTWVVTYQHQTIEGFGNRFIHLPPSNNEYDLPVCASIKKESIRGYVKARIVAERGVSVLGSYDGEWQETYEAFGRIHACSKD